MADNRAKRDDLPRTGSNRTTSTAAPTGAHRRVIERAVKLAYGVVDDHILQGQKAAERLRAGTYSSADFDSDLKHCLQRALDLSKEFGVVGMDFVDAVRRLAGPGLSGGSPVADVALEVKSKRRNQVKYDIRSSPTRFSPAVPPLHSADKTKEPLKDIHFVVRDGQRPVLVVNIPDNHPYGVYSGAIVDSETHEPAGFITVRILEDEKP